MNLNLLSGSAGGGSMWTLIIIYALIFVGIYFILIRPKSKKSKQEQELRNSLQIGDEITTIGGIVGRVIAIREEADEIVLETGSEKTRWYLSVGLFQLLIQIRIRLLKRLTRQKRKVSSVERKKMLKKVLLKNNYIIFNSPEYDLVSYLGVFF